MDRHNKMLIDATHPEETRVVVLRNGRVEEFDYESAQRKLLRGNIYLAKVTRVEPSLQAAFVDYGGNRHGFLAFSEIHPDYYQIPVADREVLKREEAEEEARAEAEADERARSRSRRGSGYGRSGGYDQDQASFREVDEADGGVSSSDDGSSSENPRLDDPLPDDGSDRSEVRRAPEYAAAASVGGDFATDSVDLRSNDDANIVEIGADENGTSDTDQIEEVTTEEDALEEVPERSRRRMRQYKIQEVIKRRQIILVQVVKEERGNKGAALTTYISLAGRYTVLMPNTGRGGGISRKITQPQDRKRLKAIAEELDVPEGMGLIIRTAGAARTKQEIKRDYEYLLRLWESVRELTLTSTAPCLVYEEGNLIKRSIRDLYSKEIEQVVVAGNEACREAQDFMGMLMPGHAENVAAYDGSEPLFTRFGIERQLNAMFSPYVTLRSGGYLVINQTEALVAIDVNSGKSTREFSIEETAYATNCEAAEEIARQLKLRDLAGLIVIDFIDMEEKRNNRTVERRIKDALRHDRARIQIGRISHFGLLEMSRQRLRTGVLEGSTTQCPHCQGTGIIRSTESVALAVLRGLEDNLAKQPASLVATTTSTVALYILNHKRTFINDMEARHGISITIESSDRMHGANFSIERTAAPIAVLKPALRSAVSMDWGFDGSSVDEEDGDVEPARDVVPSGRLRDAPEAQRDDDRGTEGDGESGEARTGRRRRRRRGRRDEIGASSPREDGFEDRSAPVESDGSNIVEIEAEDVRTPRGSRRRKPDRSWSEVDDGVSADRDPAQEVEAEGGAERDGSEADAGAVDRDDRPRRGRRRGRRGGRGRGREQSGDRAEAVAGADAPVGHDAEWQRFDVSRPGAEQPPASEHRRFDEGWTTPPGQMRFEATRADERSATNETARVDGKPEFDPIEPSAPVASEATPAAPSWESTSPRAPAIARVPDGYSTAEPRRDRSEEHAAFSQIPATPTIVRDVEASPPPVESSAVITTEIVAGPAVVPETPSDAPAASELQPNDRNSAQRDQRYDDPREAETEPPAALPRKGWWQRRFG